MTTVICTIAIHHKLLNETILTASGSGESNEAALDCASIFNAKDVDNVAHTVYMNAPTEFLSRPYPKGFYNYIRALMHDSSEPSSVVDELRKLPHLDVHVFYNNF